MNLTGDALKVFLALAPCDMRKSFNDLHTPQPSIAIPKQSPRIGLTNVFCSSVNSLSNFQYWRIF